MQYYGSLYLNGHDFFIIMDIIVYFFTNVEIKPTGCFDTSSSLSVSCTLQYSK